MPAAMSALGNVDIRVLGFGSIVRLAGASIIVGGADVFSIHAFEAEDEIGAKCVRRRLKARRYVVLKNSRGNAQARGGRQCVGLRRM